MPVSHFRYPLDVKCSPRVIGSRSRYDFDGGLLFLIIETHSGGFAQWVTNGAYGTLRNADERYLKAYAPYMDAYEKLLEPYQIQNGGNVIIMQIENEFDDTTKSGISYMRVSPLCAFAIPSAQDAPEINPTDTLT